MNRIIFLIICVEIIIVAFLGARVYHAYGKRSILGTVSFTPLWRNNYIFSPLEEYKYFYELKPNSTVIDSVNWLPDSASHSINSDALNERFEYSVVKSINTFRIITLGDSSTYGAYVNTSENYSESLEDLLTKQKCTNISNFEVINLGVPGYDIQYAAKRFQLRGEKYNPDLILWFVHADDFWEVNEFFLERALRYEQELVSKGIADTSFVDGEYYPAWNRARREIQEEYGEGALVKIELSYIAGVTRTYKGSIVFFSDRWFPAQYRKYLTIEANTRGDIRQYYGMEYDTLPDGHPSAEGHKEIAEALSAYLVQQKIIPCE